MRKKDANAWNAKERTQDKKKIKLQKQEEIHTTK